jgi:general stress protein 26
MVFNMTSSPTLPTDAASHSSTEGTAMDPKLAAVIAVIAAAPCCWFSSVRPDGRAHLAPIWHVWFEGEVYVVTQGSSVRARNIRHNRAVSLALPDPMNAIVIEGEARVAPQAQEALRPLFLEKFAWDIATDAPYDTIIAVKPSKIMAWGEHGDGRWKLG